MTSPIQIVNLIAEYKKGYGRGSKLYIEYIHSTKTENLGYLHGLEDYKKRKMYILLTGDTSYYIHLPSNKDIKSILRQKGIMTDE